MARRRESTARTVAALVSILAFGVGLGWATYAGHTTSVFAGVAGVAFLAVMALVVLRSLLEPRAEAAVADAVQASEASAASAASSIDAPPPTRGGGPSVRLEVLDAAPDISQAAHRRAQRVEEGAARALRSMRAPVLVATLLSGAAIFFGETRHVTEAGPLVAGAAWVGCFAFASSKNRVWGSRLVVVGWLVSMLIAGLHGLEHAAHAFEGQRASWGAFAFDAAAVGATALWIRSANRTLGPLGPPRPLLVLWVFDHGAGTHELVRRLFMSWSSQGPTYMLSGPGDPLDTGEMWRSLTGDARRVILETPEEARAAIASLDAAKVGPGYAPASPLRCSDASWKTALHTLIDKSPIVLFDLCRFGPERAGCRYELEALARHLPPSNVVYLVDDTTDLEGLREALAVAWREAGPPGPEVTLRAWHTRPAEAVADIERGLFLLLCEASANADPPT